MNMSLAVVLAISALGVRVPGLQGPASLDSQGDSVSQSVGSSQISVAFLDDAVSSGSAISATLTPAASISSLSILTISPNLAASLTSNDDGTYTASISTPRVAGEYVVSLCSEDLPSIDGSPNEISSIYIYSDGVNDCASCASIDEAHGKYYMNYRASEADKVLLGKEERSESFAPAKTRHEAEQDYANTAYNGGDVVTNWSWSSASLSGKVKVTGRALWYDENDLSHPLVGVKAVLWDDDIFWDECCGCTYTTEDGGFSFEIDNQTFFGLGGRDLFVAVYSETDAVLVGSFWWGEYIVVTPLFSDVTSDSQINLDIAIHPGASDRANAFECHYKVICFYFFLGLITNFLQGCPCGGIHFGLPAFFGSAKDSRSGISRAS